ncbi:MAG: replication-relaxation family protein [Rhizomicrobium sp.]
MRRTRTGKRIELTARDLEIFRVLTRYRYLSSAYIHAFVGGASETRFKERLGDLFHEGYLDRPNQQWQFAGALYQPTIYEAGDGARRVLCDQDDNDSCTFLATNAHRQFAHSMMICEVLASLEIGARHDPSLRFIGGPEILARAPADTRASATPFRMPMPNGGSVVPDGMFGLEYANGGNKTYRFFALEADRGTMPISRSDGDQTSYLGKIAAYRDLLAHRVYKIALGIPNLLVLTITTGEPRMREVMRQMEGQADSSAPFLFKTAGPSDLRLPAPGLLSEPWERAGLPALRIDV